LLEGLEVAEAAGLLGEELDAVAGLGADEAAVVAGLAAAPKVGLVAVVEVEGEAGFATDPAGLAGVLVSAALGEEEVVLGWLKTDGMVTEEGLAEEAAAGLEATEEVKEVAGLAATEEVEAGFEATEVVAEVAGLENVDVVDAAGLGAEEAAAGLELFALIRECNKVKV
jgi:hypothetical protein